MKKGNFIPKTSIDEFRKINPKFFDPIYSHYKNHKILNKIDELDYFNHFYEMLEIIDLNIDDYFNLTTYLLNIKYSDINVENIKINLSFLLFLSPISFFKNFNTFTKKYILEGTPAFYFHITDYLDEIIDYIYKKPPVKPNPKKLFYRFNYIKWELTYFKNNIEKIYYLTDVKTNFLIDSNVLNISNADKYFENPYIDLYFAEKCDLEIKKLHEFIKLEKMQPLDQVQQVEYENADFKNIKNNFDNVSIERVYNHFKNELVVKNYLSKEVLIDYIKLAFDKMESPKEKFHFSHTPRKQSITKVFYLYYKDIAGRPHRKQKEYAKLLGDYFEGYNVKNVSANFSKF